MQPAATSSLIHNFVWGWAAEWGFFILEVATALLYSPSWDPLRPRTHLPIPDACLEKADSRQCGP